MRRLWAQDKSGAGDSSAVSMEERETEEVGGSSKKNTATISVASLPPCIGVKKKAVVAVGALAVAAYFSYPRGRISPPRDLAGERGRAFLYVAVTRWGRGRRLSRRKKKKGQGQRIKRGSPASPPRKWHGDSRSCFRGLCPPPPQWRFPSCPCLPATRTSG